MAALRSTSLLTILICGAILMAARALADDARLVLHVAGAGKVVQATPGSYCLTSEGKPVCANGAYPLQTAGRTILRPGRTLRIRSAMAPASVHLRLLAHRRLSDPAVLEADLAPLNGDPRRFLLRLPKRIPCARIADVFVRYPDGDADFWAAVVVPGCGKKKRNRS
jgi:hypothetical protein